MVSLETKLAWQKDDSMIMTLLRDFSSEMMKMVRGTHLVSWTLRRIRYWALRWVLTRC